MSIFKKILKKRTVGHWERVEEEEIQELINALDNLAQGSGSLQNKFNELRSAISSLMKAKNQDRKGRLLEQIHGRAKRLKVALAEMEKEAGAVEKGAEAARVQEEVIKKNSAKIEIENQEGKKHELIFDKKKGIIIGNSLGDKLGFTFGPLVLDKHVRVFKKGEAWFIKMRSYRRALMLNKFEGATIPKLKFLGKNLLEGREVYPIQPNTSYFFYADNNENGQFVFAFRVIPLS